MLLLGNTLECTCELVHEYRNVFVEFIHFNYCTIILIPMQETGSRVSYAPAHMIHTAHETRMRFSELYDKVGTQYSIHVTSVHACIIIPYSMGIVTLKTPMKDYWLKYLKR